MKNQASRWMLIGLACALCSAPAATALAEPSPSLNEILKKTEAYYHKTQAFTATFKQWTSSAAAGTVTSEANGVLYYQKPRQMHWEYYKPEEQVFVANQNLAWLYVPAENQISLFDSKAFFSTPLAQTFFEGMVELRKHFDVSLDGRQSTKVASVLKLVPKQDDPSIRLLYLTIDLQTYQITSIESHDALGNTNRIALDTQKAHPNLDAKLFQLDIPAGATVLDTNGREIPRDEIEKLRNKLNTK
ncbi:MAG: outer membrane lipoprotein carrier protein LolA [Syntrophobacteraceae bacterium]